MMTDEQFLGQYQLLERIGQGGMAEVYRARDLTAYGREVAIKVIRNDLIEDSAWSQRFLREGRALSRLSHPHILSPIACGEENGRPYLVMPLVRDGTLSQLLQGHHGFLSPEQAIPLFGQLCQAVQYAHEEGIIHRDIKPQNVLVQQCTHVFLVDFGIALDRTQTQLTLTEAGLGSVNYMAPEQAVGQATARSDLYSLGIILYQMLTGVVPFSGDTPLQVLLKHAYDPMPDPRQFQPNLPVELVQILQTALAKDPDARFASAQALEGAVQQVGAASSWSTLPANSPALLHPGLPRAAVLQGWSAWPRGERHPQAVHTHRPGRPFLWRSASWRAMLVGAILLMLSFAALEASHLSLGAPQAGSATHAVQHSSLPAQGPSATGHSGDQGSNGDEDSDGSGHKQGHGGDNGHGGGNGGD